ncbi:MAG: hypothetical protein HQL73_09075 [Magnetococcales bacterium]|nr:hypothetical protein [Magnetococcales bacterium]
MLEITKLNAKVIQEPMESVIDGEVYSTCGATWIGAAEWDGIVFATLKSNGTRAWSADMYVNNGNFFLAGFGGKDSRFSGDKKIILMSEDEALDFMVRCLDMTEFDAGVLMDRALGM